MKQFKKSLLIAAMLATPLATNAIELTDTDTATFEISGTIEKMCKVSTYAGEPARAVDLSPGAAASTTSSVSTWCNTGQSTVATTFSSANSGKMKNEAGDEIGYTASLSGTGSAFDLTSDVTLAKVTSGNLDGSHVSRSFKVQPDVNGFERAGVYTDTITVQVAPN